MDVINLDPENFQYKQVTVPLEDCSLIYQSTDTAMRTRSRIYEGFESCFVLGPNARGSIDGAELYPYSIIAAGPGRPMSSFTSPTCQRLFWKWLRQNTREQATKDGPFSQ